MPSDEGFCNISIENVLCVYEGVSKSSQTESITKCTLTFDTGHCCHLQSSPFPSLCNRSCSATAGNTAGTSILESCVGWSEFVPEFHTSWKRHPFSSISFSETRRNHKGPNQVSKEGGGPLPCFYQPKIAALTKQCAPVHGEWTSSGSTIILDVFGGLNPSHIKKHPGSNAG
jgi:hypothetical protein